MRASLWPIVMFVAVASACIDVAPENVPGTDPDAAAPDALLPDGMAGDIPSACNPLGAGVACLMPWPSAAYLVDDASTATGVRVDLPAAAMPVNVNDVAIDPAPWNRFDGFAPSGVILAAFDGGVSADGLPPHTDIAQSLAADSPIVILNMDSGERLAFFAEVDMNTDEPAQRTLIIHPLERMAPGARYLVAIRDTVTGPDGEPLPVPEAFAAIRDGESYDHPRMAKLVPRYDAIFSALEAEGVTRDELVLAWDFVTASDAFLTSDLLTMRDRALSAMGDDAANLEFSATEVAESNPDVLRLLSGTHESPNFLDAPVVEDEFPRIIRDGSGLPMVSGEMDANFAAIIPACVETATLPIPVVIFGHGLFGSAADYLDDDYIQQIANDHCYAIVAGDFIGLSNAQTETALAAAGDLNKAASLVELLPQGIVNFIALKEMIDGPLQGAAQFQHNGTAILDPSRVYYLGASLGGIMGGVLMSYDKTITRGALGVPGGAWSVLVERSYAWRFLQAVAIGSYKGQGQPTYQMLIALLTTLFEPYDPITTVAGAVSSNTLPGVPQKHLLLYEAIGDSLVTNVSTETLVRTMGIPVTGPSVKVPYGMEETTEPVPAALTIYDEHPMPVPPLTNVPPIDDNGTHAGVNSRAAVLRQIEHFFETGEVIHACFDDNGAAAPCDCGTDDAPTGYCD